MLIFLVFGESLCVTAKKNGECILKKRREVPAEIVAVHAWNNKMLETKKKKKARKFIQLNLSYAVKYSPPPQEV